MVSKTERVLNNTFVVMLKYTNYFNQRTDNFKKSIETLIATTENIGCKIILLDNGEEEEEKYCLNLLHEKKIHAYLRVPNIGLAARNIGFDIGRELVPEAQFVVLSDDDVLFKKNWLEECIKILLEYPDKKIIATPMHSICHMDRKFSGGRLPNGCMLNKRAGANCRVYRISDMLKIGKFNRRNPKEEFFKNGVEYTNRFNKLGYLSALTRKPLVKDLQFITNKQQCRHAYPGIRGKALVELIKKCDLDPKTGLCFSADTQNVTGKNVWGEISSYLLYKFKNLFLSCTGCKKSSLNLTTKLFKNRFEFVKKEVNKTFDFIFLDVIEIETLEQLKEKLKYWTTKLNSGGVLVCYMGLSRKKYLKGKIIPLLGKDFIKDGGFIWKYK